MASSIVARTLRHGTTRQRAEAILREGPNPHFVEPGGVGTAEGFSTYPVGAPASVGTAEQYAVGKAKNFPSEGGVAVIEVEVPLPIADLAIDAGGEIRFEAGYGLEELLEAWPQLSKRIL